MLIPQIGVPMFWDLLCSLRLAGPDFTERNFVLRALDGEFEGRDLEDVIDDAIEDWHRSNSDLKLSEYLGFSDHEYMLWVTSCVRVDDLLKQRVMKR